MKQFLINIITHNSGVSSKRFNGTYGFAIFAILVIFLTLYDKIYDGELQEYSYMLLKTLAYTSSALLGIGLVENSKLMK